MEASRSGSVRLRSADLDALGDATDWERVETLSDEEIRRAMADDPDAAPELDEAFWRNAQDVLAFFKGGGGGYQSRMNAVLRAYVYARRERAGPKR